MNMITATDGTKIYFKDWGTGQPVVFSHGWPLTADAWDSQMLFLARKAIASSLMTGAATVAQASRGTAMRWTHTRMTSPSSLKRSI